MIEIPTHESQVSRSCPTCGKLIPEEAAADVIMPCGNCFVCCTHSHFTVRGPDWSVSGTGKMRA